MTALDKALNSLKQSFRVKPDTFLMGILDEIGNGTEWPITEQQYDETVRLASSFGWDPQNANHPACFFEIRRTIENLAALELANRYRKMRAALREES